MCLFKYELKKILLSKVSIIILIFFVLFCICYPAILTYEYNEGVNKSGLTLDDVNDFFRSNESNLDIDMCYEKVDLLKSNKEDSEFFTVVLGTMCNYLEEVNLRKYGKLLVTINSSLEEKENEYISLEHVNKRILELEKEEKTELPEYQRLIDEKEKIQLAGDPQLEIVYFWQQFDTYETVAVIIFIIMFIFLCAQSFTKEKESYMQIIIDSSYHGKKDILLYKCGAFFTIGIGGLLLINVCMGVILFIFGTNNGYNCTLSSLGLNYAYTPYCLNILQYCCLKVIYQSIVILIVSSILLYLLIKIDEGMIASVLSLLLVIAGFLVKIVVPNSLYLICFVSTGLTVDNLFDRYKAIHIGNQIITYPILYGCILAIILLMSMKLIFMSCKKR